MRSAWFEHVRKTREKESRGKKTKISHRDAMKLASVSWAGVKDKLVRSQARAKRKADRDLKRGVKSKLKEIKEEEKST